MGGEVTGDALAGSEVTAVKEVNVEREIAPSKGGQRQPGTHAVSTLAKSSASGDAEVEVV